ncbi:MAG: hypothetical protein V1704_04325 [Candidatus Vogelbacteria bacterium]
MALKALGDETVGDMIDRVIHNNPGQSLAVLHREAKEVLRGLLDEKEVLHYLADALVAKELKPN